MRQQIKLISDTIGQSTTIEVISEEEARELYGRVLPPQYLDLLIDQWAFGVTEQAVVTSAVRDATGREPIDYLTWAAAHRDQFI
jgi:hypothetical protein